MKIPRKGAIYLAIVQLEIMLKIEIEYDTYYDLLKEIGRKKQL